MDPRPPGRRPPDPSPLGPRRPDRQAPRLHASKTGFSTALINNVFILYHLKLYTSVYKVSDAWLYAVFVFYGVWNTLNDPLFGWVEDRAANGSLLNSLQRRLFALRAGGLVQLMHPSQQTKFVVVPPRAAHCSLSELADGQQSSSPPQT